MGTNVAKIELVENGFNDEFEVNKTRNKPMTSCSIEMDNGGKNQRIVRAKSLSRRRRVW